jgi:periplasmic divalent cation tolerance protein
MVTLRTEFVRHSLQMTDKIVILSTCASEEEGEQLARMLVEQRLAACVSLIPRMRSFYRWNGAIEAAEECLMIVKTSRELFEQLRRVLEEAHSYELPESLALAVLTGSPSYLNWLEGSLRTE